MRTDNEERLEHIVKELVCYATTVNGCVDETGDDWKSWHKTDPEERGHPPHIIAGWRLDGSFHQVQSMLDVLRHTRPELEKRWESLFKELFAENGKIIDDWKSRGVGWRVRLVGILGAWVKLDATKHRYNASLEKAFRLSYRVRGMAIRVDAVAQELAHESSAGVVGEIEQAETATLADRIEPQQSGNGSVTPSTETDATAEADRPNQADEYVEITEAIKLWNLPVSASTIKDDCKSRELPSKRKSTKLKSSYLVRRSDCTKLYCK